MNTHAGPDVKSALRPQHDVDESAVGKRLVGLDPGPELDAQLRAPVGARITGGACGERECTDKDFLFGFQVDEGGIDVRYKYYAYRWDFTYAPQMHHKFMAIDGTTLYSGSYNLSDNAEHGTFENMMVLKGPEHASLIKAFEANFESIWKTGKDDNKLSALNARIDQGGEFPIVFDAMALTGEEITALKQKIRAACPAVDTMEFRKLPSAHKACSR